jgi:hypothetical protein
MSAIQQKALFPLNPCHDLFSVGWNFNGVSLGCSPTAHDRRIVRTRNEFRQATLKGIQYRQYRY